uniref:Uncharacterized protein n=1 Tax=Toxoplasma gondii (strain ATCC 50861 / VEG) TaxID=432359 RepID=A0A0F7USW9_TOXGV|nr:TPA: hypothetical protein BN1205_104860 [Toxoplasma gondii VEG]
MSPPRTHRPDHQRVSYLPTPLSPALFRLSLAHSLSRIWHSKQHTKPNERQTDPHLLWLSTTLFQRCSDMEPTAVHKPGVIPRLSAQAHAITIAPPFSQEFFTVPDLHGWDHARMVFRRIDTETNVGWLLLCVS